MLQGAVWLNERPTHGFPPGPGAGLVQFLVAL